MRTPFTSISVTLGIALLVAAISAPGIGASGRPECLVSNPRTDVGARSLQDAQDLAIAGDTLIIKGLHRRDGHHEEPDAARSEQ